MIRAAIILCCASLSVLAADVEAQRVRTGGRGRSHWHLGPFFEYRRSEPGPASWWAVRPLFSQVKDPATDTSVFDFLWPLCTYHSHRNADWWRALVAYGDSREDDPTWSFNIFPLWFSGCDRKDDGYWGLFPIYGNHPHFLFMDDWEFILWPVWQTYEVKGVRSRAVLWPLVTWRDDPRSGTGVWPFYGNATRRESEHSYLLWPLYLGELQGGSRHVRCWIVMGVSAFLRPDQACPRGTDARASAVLLLREDGWRY